MEKILKTIDALKMPSLITSSDANIPGTISSAVIAASDAVKTKYFIIKIIEHLSISYKSCLYLFLEKKNESIIVEQLRMPCVIQVFKV